MLLTAGLALPMGGRPPLADAAVLIDGERIVAVGTRAEIMARPETLGHERRDFGDAMILPGLVNAHIHLEYTHLGPIPAPKPLLPWLRGLVAWSQERSPQDWLDSARHGAWESLRGGVTSLGEIVTRGAGLEAMAGAGLHGMAYLEFIGGRGADLEPSLERLDGRVARASELVEATGNPSLRVGVSPHTPYSVARLAILAVEPGDDPYRAVLAGASAESVRCTVLGGRIVHESSGT